MRLLVNVFLLRVLFFEHFVHARVAKYWDRGFLITRSGSVLFAGPGGKVATTPTPSSVAGCELPTSAPELLVESLYVSGGYQRGVSRPAKEADS
jgi:hypothetical protein